MRVRVLVVALLALAATAPALAEEWTKARIERLPDSAFAVVEIAEDGKRVRHLPHHTEQGEVDISHLRSALSRLGQVKWLDPANESVARRHLEGHQRELKSRP